MTVSVGLCTYNGAQFLRNQLDSILNQTFKVNEIVICDDGSTDETHRILSEYKNNFPEIFKIFINPANLRSVKNFEKAISLCTGDLIFLSDQDDVWTQHKVMTYLDYFQRDQAIDVLCSNGYIIDDQNADIESYTLWDAPEFLLQNNKEIDYYTIFSTIGNFATGASMALKKTFIDTIIPFPVIEGFHHDEWIALKAAEQKKFAFLNEKLFHYRVHTAQQVGGISYPKNEISKEKIIHKFDYTQEPKSFRDFKTKIRTLCDKERKFKQYLDHTENNTIERLYRHIQLEKEQIYKKANSKNPLFSLLFKYLYQ